MLLAGLAPAQVLPLPERATNALSGSALARRLAPLSLPEREQELYTQVLSGNVPAFLRKLCPVPLTSVSQGRTNIGTIYVTPDYLCLGSEEDYLLMPLSPNLAQRIADALDCSLPTPRMVDAIYAAAPLKFAPTPIPPSPVMITLGVFTAHNEMVRTQRLAQISAYPLGTLVAGHKKDVVLSVRLARAPGRVAIYGWQRTNGIPIQPLYVKHLASWVDYSQCTRLVQQDMLVNGVHRRVAEVLADPGLCALLSNEGALPNPRYPTNSITSLAPATNPPSATAHIRLPPIQFVPSRQFQERTASFTVDPDIKVCINVPGSGCLAPEKQVLLVFYALPNGNSIDQTIGKRLQPGDDWHYDIQHIGAQTRFLRQLLPDRALVVVYLQAAQKSWPAWRRLHGDSAIPELVNQVRSLFAGHQVDTVLSGHSGGGSLIFGYLNAVPAIPDDIVRIAFLDSDYAYDPARGHAAKLARWLKASNEHCLCVLAYDDSVVRLNGKPIVSLAGGTWGRSHLMQHDLAQDFAFTSVTNAGLEHFSALDGRLQFLLKENPDKAILHTVQVERNGFIHCLLSGTSKEGNGYTYFGPRAYSKFIDTGQPFSPAGEGGF